MQNVTAPEHMDHRVDLNWESVQSWMEKVIGEGRVAEIGLTVSALTILCWMLFALHKAMQNYQILGSTLF